MENIHTQTLGLKQFDDHKGKIPRHKQASSRDNEFETPDDLYYSLCKKYKIVCELDPFASEWIENEQTKSNSKCLYYFTYEQNALTKDYLLPSGEIPRGVWINHPHTLHKEVLKHNLEQWQKLNLDMIMIIPANTIRPAYFFNYVAKYLHHGIDIEPLINPETKDGYINFKKHGKDTKHISRNAYLVIRYHSKKPRKNSNL